VFNGGIVFNDGSMIFNRNCLYNIPNFVLQGRIAARRLL